MARKPKLISAPTARGGGGGNTWQQMKGTMFAYSPDDGPIGPMPDGVQTQTFEAPDDINYERMVTERERELGLPAEFTRVSGSAYQPPVYDPGPVTYVERAIPSITPIADLTPLPDRFSLAVERKGDMWKVTAPTVHTGLWKAGEDLPQVVHEALAALAEMVRIDGVVAKGRRK